ncbi:MAG: LytTR family transcriptional regulator DNA-binding domain-containing protein [Tannerellaceae bacterium]|nr:LytTR family transcriptional regulator DNA-binding domain-containing protein [Tannerellaceae bacterium]
MNFWNQKLPGYIYEKGNIIRLILLTAFFALVFINIYKPFGSPQWYPVSEFKFFIFSSLIILTGVLVVVISRVIMFYRGRKHAVTFGQYACWIPGEIFFMSLFYTIYSLSVNPAREWLHVFKESAVNTSLVLLLPYAALHLYFSYRDKERRLRMLEEDGSGRALRTSVYNFYDEKGELRLSVKKENLLYIESADNYVLIWYINKEHPAKFMLRNSLRSLKECFAETPVHRCHRSFMVNFEQVRVVRRQKDGLFMEFDIPGVPDIPISKSYSEKVTHWFMTYSS